MKGKKLVSLSMAAVMCAGGLAVYGEMCIRDSCYYDGKKSCFT